MSNRRKFSAEFRAEGVELVISWGRAIAQGASGIGVNEGTLGNWVRVWKDEHPEAGATEPGPVEWAKYKALQAEEGSFPTDWICRKLKVSQASSHRWLRPVSMANCSCRAGP